MTNLTIDPNWPASPAGFAVVLGLSVCILLAIAALLVVVVTSYNSLKKK